MKHSTVENSFDSDFALLVDNELKDRSVIAIVQQESAREKKLLQQLKDSEQRHALTLQVTNDGIWSWDLSSDRIDYSDRWKLMVGCTDREIKNNPLEWLVRVHPAEREKLRQNLAACRQGQTDCFEMEYSLLHRDGQYRFMHCKCLAVKNVRGVVTSLIGSQTDISEQKQIKAQLDYVADYDQLTKLPNRQLFIAKLRELSELKQHPDYRFGVLCLDLDRFKNVNHNFGHSIGDRLLKEIVSKLKSCLRTRDLVARIGGDEFAILLAGFEGVDYPLVVAAGIQQAFAKPIEVAEHSILIGISIGIATPQLMGNCLWTDADTANNLVKSLQNAEIAMNQAKAKGKACNRVFESEAYLQNLAKTKSEDDLRQAIEQKQFELHYQPIVKLENRQLVGFEALIRWQHPERGLIFPSDFIPLAEETGLITPIGWWVLRSACSQMVLWQQTNFQAKSMFMSVNITGKQFSQPYAGDIIAQILEETGLNPACLKLEITESEIIENIELVLSTVEKLKDLGVQLSMDDFGTGYSSLSYLHCLPVDTLKIDRSFIQDLESDCHKLELVKTIIKLAEVFDLELIAEGIESEPQCARLIELGCQYAQGYLFSEPVLPASAATLLKY
ncbi:MAG TPA: EAL domain-containing protein [Coleofasciculaceae cyanobacterium]